MAAIESSVPVGVVGAGTMGAGIAQVAATAGHPVRLYDVADNAADRAVIGLGERLRRLAAKGRMDERDAIAACERIVPVDSLTALADCGLVVEAIVEDLHVKRALFAELAEVCGPESILATNTSSLSVTAIADGLGVAARVAGLHFFNPAPLLPLVEVVAGDATHAAVVDQLADTAEAWGKTPVRAASTPGFIVNRVARPYYAEAFRLLAAGVADAATIDALLREAGGFRMGPCELTDLIGQDVNAAVTRSVWEAFGQDPRFEPSHVQDALVHSGRLGRKTGRGLYETGAASDPACAPPGPRPARVGVIGAGGPLESLVARLDDAGLSPVRTGDPGPIRLRLADGIAVRLTDGRIAAAVTADSGEPTVLIDLALDYGAAARVAIAGPSTAPAAAESVAGLLQAAGLTVTVLPDSPGLVVARTVAMLSAFAADTVDAGVATAADVDTAMRLGVNYPRGPVEWGDALGWGWVSGMLDALARSEDAQRYRVPTGLRDRPGAING